jgi:DNA gyrase subunit A
MEVIDDPCWVLLSSTGLMARTTSDEPLSGQGGRHKHDAVIAAVRTTARGSVGLVTSRGRMIRLSALELPTLPPTNGAPSLSGGAPLAAFVDLPRGEEPLTITSLSTDSPGIAVGTAQGVVKRVSPDYPGNRDDWELIALKDGDVVVGAVELATGEEDLVFLTSDAQLLHFPAASVRPQGRAAGGVAGIKLAPRARAVFFGAVDPTVPNLVVTSSGSSGALPGTEPGSLKVTSFYEYPAKGRATGGVRAHRFLRGEDTLVLAWVGAAPARAAAANGVAVELPAATGKRDGSGTPASTPIAAVAGALPGSVVEPE